MLPYYKSPAHLSDAKRPVKEVAFGKNVAEFPIMDSARPSQFVSIMVNRVDPNIVS